MDARERSKHSQEIPQIRCSVLELAQCSGKVIYPYAGDMLNDSYKLEIIDVTIQSVPNRFGQITSGYFTARGYLQNITIQLKPPEFRIEDYDSGEEDPFTGLGRIKRGVTGTSADSICCVLDVVPNWRGIFCQCLRIGDLLGNYGISTCFLLLQELSLGTRGYERIGYAFLHPPHMWNKDEMRKARRLGSDYQQTVPSSDWKFESPQMATVKVY